MHKRRNLLLNKMRLGWRALYASLTPENARALAHKNIQLEQKNRRLDIENRDLLKSLSSDNQNRNEYNLNFKQRLEGYQTQEDDLSNAALWILYDLYLYLNASMVLPPSSGKFTHVIAHDVLGLGCAASFAKLNDAQLWIDVVEDHVLTQRTGAYYRENFMPSDHDFIQSYINTHIHQAHHWLHIGDQQAKRFEARMGKKGHIVPNYRNKISPTQSDVETAEKRLAKAGLQGRSFWVMPNKIHNPEELILFSAALDNMKSPDAIVHIGAPVSKDFLQALPQKTRNRFVEISSLDFEDYLVTLSLAKASVMINTADNFNAQDAMPNRLFDSIAAGTPLFVMGYNDASKFVRKHNIGQSMPPTHDVKDVRSNIDAFLANHSELKHKVIGLSQNLSWNKAVDTAISNVPKSSKVLIISRKNLQTHQRSSLMAQSLRAKGHDVIVIGGDRENLIQNGSTFTVPYTFPLTPSDCILACK